MLNSKEALEKISWRYVNDPSFQEWCNIIKQDLERLEKLEKEHEKLKERYKHRAETSNDLCKTVKQYEKAFDIVTYKSVNILILKYCIAKGGGG